MAAKSFRASNAFAKRRRTPGGAVTMEATEHHESSEDEGEILEAEEDNKNDEHQQDQSLHKDNPVESYSNEVIQEPTKQEEQPTSSTTSVKSVQ